MDAWGREKRNTYAATEKKATNPDLTLSTAYNCDIATRELSVCPCPVTARPDRGKTAVSIVSRLIEKAHIDGDAIFNIINSRENAVSTAADGNVPITSTLASRCEGCQGKRDLAHRLWLDKAPRVQPGTNRPVRLNTPFVGWVSSSQYT